MTISGVKNETVRAEYKFSIYGMFERTWIKIIYSTLGVPYSTNHNLLQINFSFLIKSQQIYN